MLDRGGTYYNKMGEDKDMKSDKIIKYMYKMFSTTKATEIIGLNNFKTSKVTDMAEMFYSMPNLLTIYVSDKFVTDKVTTTSPNMLSYTTKLVGGSVTKFDNTKTNKTYARIDGGTNSPGYFTLKTN